MRLRHALAAAVLAASSLFAAPAPAAFSNGQMQEFVAMLNAKEGLSATQQKALDQINATVEKEYAAFSKELVAYAKVVTFANKAFPEDEGVQAAIAALCNDQGLGSIYFDLVFGGDGTGAAGIILNNEVGTVKGALLYYKWVAKHFNKGVLEEDCAKKLKLYAKAAKGTEKVVKKYGPLDT